MSQGIGFVKMTDWDERKRSQLAIAEELRPKLFGVPGVMAFPGNPPPLGQSVRDKPVSLRDPDLAGLRQAAGTASTR